MTDMHVQRLAAAKAKKQRSQYLFRVLVGDLSPMELLAEALIAENHALRSLELSQVFDRPLPGAPADTHRAYVPWRAVRRRLLETLALDPATPNRRLTVSWVHDPRAGGRRWFALCDALRPRDQRPWPGFPWQPAPEP